MLNKAVLVTACVLLLSACDDGKAPKPAKVVSQEQQAKQVASETALYLPGGAGVDFGRMPIHDESREDEHSKIRVATYEFIESFEVIDNSFASIVQAAGYVRKVHVSEIDKLSVSYRKPGANPVLTQYAFGMKEGVDGKTILNVSWRYK